MRTTNRNLKRLLRGETYFYCVIFLGFAIAALAYRSYLMAAAEGLAAVVTFLVTLLLSRSRARGIADYVQQSVDVLSGPVVADSPFLLLTARTETGEIVWHSKQFQQSLGAKESLIGRPLADVLPGLSLDWLQSGKSEADAAQLIRGRRYQVYGYAIDPKDEDLCLLELIDSTELLDTRDEYLRTRPVVAIILVDNYDELTNNLPDNTISSISAQLNERINTWAEDIGGLLRKMERNRFLFLFETQALHRVTENKFAILDTIREITSPAGIAATVSIGLGKDGSGFQANYDQAILALEMALSRGGDQAVIKDKYDFSFYGGRSQETDRHTKVKARVMASSLSALIEQSSNVFIMGHSSADADATGAAAGLCCLCRQKGRRAYVVTDLQANVAKKLVAMLAEAPEYKDCFLGAQDAILLADSRSLLIVVDTNRPDQVESRSLLESMTRVAVIDHHRRAADYISNAALNLHEPFASSTAELVTEILMYAVNPEQILPCELKALLAGIVLDTKNFTVRVNSRTFEAAAFLRRLGADTVAVKRLFQNDFESTVTRYQIIENAKVYRGSIAVASIDREVPRALAGQAADELLSIDGISSSFVLFRQKDAVFISARSIDAMNVQVVLEPLGGGGNAATAGAQVRSQSVGAVQQTLLAAIDRYLDT